jgi:hypothetical protein
MCCSRRLRYLHDSYNDIGIFNVTIFPAWYASSEDARSTFLLLQNRLDTSRLSQVSLISYPLPVQGILHDAYTVQKAGFRGGAPLSKVAFSNHLS